MSWDRHPRGTKAKASDHIVKIQSNKVIITKDEGTTRKRKDPAELMDRALKKPKKLWVQEVKQKVRENACVQTELAEMPDKGTIVLVTQPVQKGDFVCEYRGDFITFSEAQKREEMYLRNYSGPVGQKMACYMFYFAHRDAQYCIDATEDRPNLGIGRLLSHSCDGNLYPIKMVVDGSPRIILVAKRNIQVGEELAYDYGERSERAKTNFPWLNS